VPQKDQTRQRLLLAAFRYGKEFRKGESLMDWPTAAVAIAFIACVGFMFWWNNR
jgi:hypothetical protein